MGHPLVGSFDRDSSQPLYQQIEQIIFESIQNGALREGDMLPNERLMQDIYGVSRQTVRQALLSLEKGGYIERIQGVGTRVTQKNPKPQNKAVTSMTEDILARGQIAESKTLCVVFVIPPEKVVDSFGMKPGEKCICIHRLRLADGVPIAFNELYIPPDFDFSARELEYMQSYYHILKEKFNLTPIQANDVLRACKSNSEQAESLKIPEGAMLVELERVSFGADRTPLEFTNIYCLPEHFEYRIFLSNC